jgi:hypothetical protein
MIQLMNNQLTFSFPEVHPDCKVSIEFQRTFRIPDDGKTYPLPPGLGTFPLKLVDEYKQNVHPEWRERGGIFLPMYQAEALWIRFLPKLVRKRGGKYPFAIKIAAGKRSAITGKKWAAVLKEGDYCIIPEQPWIDGFVTDNGRVKQFVATPLGAGATVEGQLTGEEKFGGIQIEVFPMRFEEFDKRFPKIKEQKTKGGILRSRSVQLASASIGDSWNGCGPAGAMTMDWMATEQERGMGMGAGGSMKQEIFEDKYGFEMWDRNAAPVSERRVFVHLANSALYRSITDEFPPHHPITAEMAARYGYPWFEHYNDDFDLRVMGGSKKHKGIKTVKELKPELLPENQSVTVPKCKVVKVNPGEVRNGSW